MKKKALIFSAILLMLSYMGGCASSPKPARDTSAPVKTETVKMDVGVLRGQTAIGIIKMIDEKPSLGKGIKVNYVIEQSPEVLSSKLLSGEMEMATIPTNMAATLYNKGVPYQLAAMNTWGVMYVVSTDNSVSKWADLQGKSIGAVSKGSSADVVFKYLLNKNGINPDQDLTINYNPSPVEAAQLMIAGKTKLACLPEPWVSVVLSKNPQAKAVFDLQKEWTRIQGADIPFAQTCLVVNKKFASQHPEAVKSLLSECAESINWVNQNPNSAADLMKKNDIGIPADVAAAAIPRCNLRYMDALEARPAIENYLKVLLEFSPETVGGKIPDDKFYYQK